MTFTIESLGCAKNQVDSEELIAHLERAGLAWVPEAQAADALVVNTCGFIQSAKEESIRTALELKARYPGKRVIVAGCLVARYGAELQQALTELDGFVGLRDAAGIRRILLPDADDSPRSAEPRRRRFLSYPGSAYVKVAEGCDNRCSYCAIPLIRGPLASRPLPEIVAEVQALVAQNVQEVILIAQDLAAYGAEQKAGGRLPELLRELLRLPGGFWLRCLYIHPDHFPEELPELAAADPRLLPYFDLPFQHAAREVLQRMGRRGSAAGYLGLVRRIRARLPQAVLRSTFLVGFPGETEEHFQSLLDFQREAALDWVGAFAFSREEGTAAHAFTPRVNARTAAARKRALERAQTPITEARLERQVGRELEVLVEEPVQGESLALGRAYLQAPEVDGLVVVKAGGLEAGSRVRVRIERRNGVDLEGSLV